VTKIPARVGALAERYRLGTAVDRLKAPNPVVEFVLAVVLALVAFGLAWLVNWLLTFVPVKPLALLVVALILIGIAIMGLGMFRLFRGFSAVYRFEGGIVWTRNGRAQAAPWSTIDELGVARTDGKVTNAALTTFDGRRIPLEGDNPTAFVDGIEQVVNGHRRPVRDHIFSDDVAAPDLPIPHLVMLFLGTVFGALAITVAVLLFRAGLDGDQGALTVVAGFGLIGLLALILGLRFDQRFVMLGLTFIGIAAAVALITSFRTFSGINPYLAATAVLAVEVALLSLGSAAYRRLPARRPTGYRRRLAARRGWQFATKQDVPVGGPWTAWTLIGVPENSTSTTLTDVVTGSIDGVPFIVGDRIRRRRRNGDPIQTVWLVALPFAFPSVYRDDRFRRGVSEAGDPEVAALMDGRRPTSTGPLDTVPTWWIEGPYLYATGVDNRRATLANAEKLTRFAANLPWNDLQRLSLRA
jgi:hypothetical protein